MKQSTDTPLRSERLQDSMLLKVLLACGVASSLVYAATDVLASSRYEGYEWTARMVSDLLAVSAPTRSFIVVPMLVYNLLIIAFGTGVWLRGRSRPLRVAGALFLAYGIVSMLGLFVFPLNYGAAAEDSPDIYEDRVVYEKNGDIWIYDLLTSRERPVVSRKGLQECPSIWGDLIAYADWGTGLADIWVHDLRSGTDVKVVSSSGVQYSPSLCGRTIIYEQYSVPGCACSLARRNLPGI